MSWASAKFFDWLGRTPFYEAVHVEAVRRLGPGVQRTWLDVGCGPGLVAELAARQGFRATGVDRDPAMILAAERGRGGVCRFVQADLAQLGALPRFDVVSAASLLILLPDPRAGLVQLWSRVVPGGSLLVIETSPEMRPGRAITVNGHPGLALWAWARAGRAIDPTVFAALSPFTPSRHALLDGLVDAWIVRRPKEGGP